MASYNENVQVSINARDNASSKFARVSSNFASMGQKMKATGRTLTFGLTAPIVGVGAAAVKSFADFNEAMTESQSIMGDLSEKTMQKMEDKAKQVAKTTNFSNKQAAESYFYLASAGLDAEQSMASLGKVAEFAQAGAFDMSQATDLLTDSQSALGLTVDDTAQNMENMTRVSDVFVKANTLANAKVEEFASAMTNKAGAALKNMNVSLEEGTAILARFADQGLKGQRAGTILTRTLEGLFKYSEKNAAAFDRLGIQVKDANGEMRDIDKIIADMEGAFGDMSTAQRQSAMEQLGFNRRVTQGINAMLGGSSELRTYREELENAGGTAAEVAEKQGETLWAKIREIGDAFRRAGISMVDNFQEPLMNLANRISGFFDRIAEMSPSSQKMITAFLGIAAAAGPLIWITGQLISSITAIAKAMQFVKGLSFASSLGALANPAGLAMVAIVALAGAAYYFRDELKAAYEWLQKTEAWDMAKTMINNVWVALQELWTQIKNQMLPALKDLWADLDFLKPVLKFLAKSALVVIASKFTMVARIVIWLAKRVADLVTAFSEFGSMVAGSLKGYLDDVVAGFHEVKDAIDGALDKLQDWIEQAADGKLGDWSRSIWGDDPLAAIGLASGGVARAGNLHLVGEEGPELFVPGQTGRVVPNDTISSGGGNGGDTYNVYVEGNQIVGDDEAGEVIGDKIVNSLKFEQRI